jgi:glutamyl-tRNA reductase
MLPVKSTKLAIIYRAVSGASIVYSTAFADWKLEFRELDILVSSTAALHAIITLDKLAPFWRARRHRPLFMIDLAMPRDIDPAVQSWTVYLYDLDSLQSIADRTLAFRKQESEKCFQLIERHVHEFQSWMERSRTFNSPSIVAVVGRSQTDCG